jgi:UDP-glucose 4-epimerase
VISRACSPSPLVNVPYEEAYGPGYEELGDRAPDTSALRKLTGWIPRRTIDETIDQMIAARRSELPVRDNGRRAEYQTART